MDGKATIQVGLKTSSSNADHRLVERSRYEESMAAQGNAAPASILSFGTLSANERASNFAHACIPRGIQAKLTVNAPNDAYEREADAVAERVTRMVLPPSAGVMPATDRSTLQHGTQAQTQTIQTKTTDSAQARSSTHTEPAVRAAGFGGAPMSGEVRSYFEPRFGVDFSGVRIHTDGNAARAADALNARAYTHDGNIVFGAGEYAPSTIKGQRLLAHELAHVVQQASGFATGHIQTKPGTPKKVTTHRVPLFRIDLTQALDKRELLHEFVRLYYGLTSEAEIRGKLPTWTMSRGTNPEELKRGYVLINIHTDEDAAFAALDSAQQKQINAETDQRFWNSTGYKPGQKLGNSAQDKAMAKVWKGQRRAVMTEERQRKEIDALPQDIKDVLFAGGSGAPSASPDDYSQLLRIAHKLAQLPPEARQDYLSRVNASTSSLDSLENSIDNYMQFRQQRAKQAEDNETSAKPLLGAEDLYERYKAYQRQKANVGMARTLKGAARDKGMAEKSTELLESQLKDTETALLADLKKNRFNSIAAFENAIESYRIAFRTQAVNLALDVLAHYEHMLFEERKKLQHPGYAGGIVKGIAATQASAHYSEAHSKELSATMVHFGYDPKDSADNNASIRRDVAQLRSAAASARSNAEAEVISGSGNDKLVAERGTDREKLAGLDAAGVQTYLSKTLDERAEQVRTAREEFNTDPDRVFRLPDLISASEQIQGIDANTIYGKIISDYVANESFKHLLSSIAVMVLVVALALLVPGGGWIAAAALVANAGISTYQAYAAYKEYEEQSRDYNLHFLSAEPSLFWVGLAIAAAAVDMGVATSVVVKESAAALESLKGPMLQFSKDGDLATLSSKIDATDLRRVKLDTALKREAEASLAANDALKEMSGKLFAFSPSGPPDPGLVKQAFRFLYYTVKRGVNTIAKLRADAKFVQAMGDVTQMTSTNRAELEAAFEEVKQLVKAGQARSMDETSLLGYVDRWALNRGNTNFQNKLLNEMKAWKPLSPEQQAALDALNAQKGAVNTLYQQKAAAQEELAALRAKATRTPEDIAEIRELEKELTKLDPHWDPKARPTNARGKIAEAEANLTDKERDAAKSQLTLYDRLRAVAPGDAAKERALKGATVDQVGPLKTPPTPLHADHIVSVREISDMDGFADLSWKDQKAIVDMKDNLIAMDGSANVSKGNRTWRSWKQASKFYDQSTIETMAKREAEVRAAIQKEIQARLHPTGLKH